LTKEIDATTKKIEQTKEKEDVVVDKKTAKKKKTSGLEQKLTTLQRDLTFMKFKSTILVTVLMVVTVSSMGNQFQGKPVARLPFEPFSLLTSISHRGLVGDDFTECSYIFIYVIVSYLIRGNIQKIFGFENNPKSSLFNPFGMQMPQQV
jgi:calcium load-activated calcium channel